MLDDDHDAKLTMPQVRSGPLGKVWYLQAKSEDEPCNLVWIKISKELTPDLSTS